MARHKEFDVETALDNAIDFFWKHGYGRTSLNDLLVQMGIGRASFYNAFGDKQSQALKRYQKRHNKGVILDTLTQAEIGLTGIYAVFEQVVDGLPITAAFSKILPESPSARLNPNNNADNAVKLSYSLDRFLA